MELIKAGEVSMRVTFLMDESLVKLAHYANRLCPEDRSVTVPVMSGPAFKHNQQMRLAEAGPNVWVSPLEPKSSSSLFTLRSLIVLKDVLAFTQPTKQITSTLLADRACDILGASSE